MAEHPVFSLDRQMERETTLTTFDAKGRRQNSPK